MERCGGRLSAVSDLRRRQAFSRKPPRGAARRGWRHGRRRHGRRLRKPGASRLPLGGRELMNHIVKACILAVGSEMLTPFRVDTNSLTITERLNQIGCDVRLKAVVADAVGELADVV